MIGQSMVMEMRPVARHELRIEQRHPISTLIRVWNESKHYTINIGGHDIEFVICDHRYLHLLDDEEHYGLYVGNMTFVSTQTPERWFPFVVLHGWLMNRYGIMPDDWYDTDLDRHEAALHDELRAAGAAIEDTEEFRAYLYWRRSVERTPYFNESDPEIQAFFEEERRRGIKPPSLGKWTRRTLAVSKLVGVLGYDAAKELGATHAQLLLQGLAESSLPAGDVHAVISATAHTDSTTQTQLPKSLSAAVYALGEASSYPVLQIVGEKDDRILVQWHDGRSGQTLRAMARRLAHAQHRNMSNGISVQLPSGSKPRLGGGVAPETTPRRKTQTRMASGTATIIRDMYGKILIRILRECRTYADMNILLSGMPTRAQARFRGWLAKYNVAVPDYARDVSLLPLGTIAELLAEAKYDFSKEERGVLPLDQWHDPRPLENVVEANIPLFIELLEWNRVDDVTDFVLDHCDRGFDAVPWLVLFLTQSLDWIDDEHEMAIIDAHGNVNHKTLKTVLAEEHSIDLDEEARMIEPEENEMGSPAVPAHEPATERQEVALAPTMLAFYETLCRVWTLLLSTNWDRPGIPSTVTTAIARHFYPRQRHIYGAINALSHKGLVKRHGEKCTKSTHAVWELLNTPVKLGKGPALKAKKLSDDVLRQIIRGYVPELANWSWQPAEVAQPPEQKDEPSAGATVPIQLSQRLELVYRAILKAWSILQESRYQGDGAPSRLTSAIARHYGSKNPAATTTSLFQKGLLERHGGAQSREGVGVWWKPLTVEVEVEVTRTRKQFMGAVLGDSELFKLLLANMPELAEQLQALPKATSPEPKPEPEPEATEAAPEPPVTEPEKEEKVVAEPEAEPETEPEEEAQPQESEIPSDIPMEVLDFLSTLMRGYDRDEIAWVLSQLPETNRTALVDRVAETSTARERCEALVQRVAELRDELAQAEADNKQALSDAESLSLWIDNFLAKIGKMLTVRQQMKEAERDLSSLFGDQTQE